VNKHDAGGHESEESASALLRAAGLDPGLVLVVSELSKRMDDGFAAVNDRIDDTRGEMVGAIKRLTRAQDGTSDRVNHQNGRLFRVERRQDEDHQWHEDHIRKMERRWNRFRRMLTWVGAIIVAIIGSLSLVFFDHLWR
jgi:hypothetical protein